MRAHMALLILALSPALSSCGFDLTEIAPSPERAQLSVNLAVGAAAGPLAVGVVFHPGTTERGEPRPLADDVLWVAGSSVEPERIRGDGALVYQVGDLDASAAPLLFRAPAVAGLGEPPPEFTTEPLRVVGGDTLTVPDSGTLEIHLAGVGDARALENGGWLMRIYPDTGRAAVLTLQAKTPPPPALRVPADLLPPDLVRGRVELHVSLQRSFTSEGGGYDIRVFRSLSGSFGWRIEPPTP